MYKSLFVALAGAVVLSCTIRDKQPTGAAVKATAYDTAFQLTREAAALLKDGDLVLRNGQEVSSQIIKRFSRTNKAYSHAGLVFFRNGEPLVYHILPGVSVDEQKLRADSLQVFCNPRQNAGFAVFRYDLSADEITRLHKQIEEWKTKEVAFDSTFNPATDDRMYCSEMIRKGLMKATANRITLATTKPTAAEARFFSGHLKLPLAYTTNLDVVAIDNLYLTPHCKQVRRFEYRKP